MKNRTLIGVVCIILAIVITFGVSPMVNKMTEGKVKVVCFSNDISKGSKVSEDNIAIIEIAKAGLPEKAIKNKAFILFFHI